MRLLLAPVLLTLLLASCTLYETSLRGPANIFYRDDRVTHARQEFPQWGSLHKGPQREHPWGTGFIIDRCYVGSAYHNVVKTDIELTGEETLYFDTPLRDEPQKVTPVAWGNASKATSEQLNAEDWVILKLENCFEKDEVEPLKLLPLSRELLTDHPLMLAGFPEDRHPKNITVDFECLSGPEVLRKENGIGHDCATRPGNSGSPLVSRMQGRENEVVAIVVASRGYFQEIIDGYSEWIANKACPIGPMATALKKLKEKN